MLIGVMVIKERPCLRAYSNTRSCKLK